MSSFGCSWQLPGNRSRVVSSRRPLQGRRYHKSRHPQHAKYAAGGGTVPTTPSSAAGRRPGGGPPPPLLARAATCRWPRPCAHAPRAIARARALCKAAIVRWPPEEWTTHGAAGEIGCRSGAAQLGRPARALLGRCSGNAGATLRARDGDPYEAAERSMAPCTRCMGSGGGGDPRLLASPPPQAPLCREVADVRQAPSCARPLPAKLCGFGPNFA